MSNAYKVIMPGVDDGGIPWSAEEYFAVLDERIRLVETPQDDWNRRLQQFILDDKGYRFNPDIIENQLSNFMVARYREVPKLTVMSYLHRYFTINEFLSHYQYHLLRDQILRSGKDGAVEVPVALIEVLATTAYDGTHHNPGGHLVATFNYERVVRECQEKLQTEDDQEKES